MVLTLVTYFIYTQFDQGSLIQEDIGMKISIDIWIIVLNLCCGIHPVACIHTNLISYNKITLRNEEIEFGSGLWIRFSMSTVPISNVSRNNFHWNVNILIIDVSVSLPTFLQSKKRLVDQISRYRSVPRRCNCVVWNYSFAEVLIDNRLHLPL